MKSFITELSEPTVSDLDEGGFGSSLKDAKKAVDSLKSSSHNIVKMGTVGLPKTKFALNDGTTAYVFELVSIQ